MPAGIKDDALWTKAKTQLEPKWGELDQPWAAVMALYKQMGGEADKSAEEACSTGAMGQLMRAGEADWRDKAALFVSLREAQVDSARRRVKVALVTEGPGNLRDRNYYTDKFIKSAAIAYEGARSYLNHMTEAEDKSRPEGNIRELCGFYEGLSVQLVRDRKTGKMVDGVVGWLNTDDSQAGREAFTKACAQIEYSKLFPNSTEEYCGLSISGSGLREGVFDFNNQKWNRIVGVGQADSVDVVTRPARGGAFLSLTESAIPAPNTTTEEHQMKKDILAIMAELTEATAELTAASTDEARKAAKTKVDELTTKMSEAAKKTGKEADPAADDEDDDLKKMVPKGSEEADDAYASRLANIKGKLGKGKESVVPDSADELRTNFPKLFEAVAARVRASVDEKGEDIKKMKDQLREANTKLVLLQDKELATKLLSEAGVPVKLLGVDDLVGMTESEMKREIEKTVALIEAAGGRVFVPSDSKKPAPMPSKLAESIAKMKEAAAA